MFLCRQLRNQRKFLPMQLRKTHLCYVMLCYVILCYVMLYYVMLCYVMLCSVVLCYIVLCCVMLCCVMLCYVMLCCVVLCCVMLCYVMLCYVMFCCVMLCYVISNWGTTRDKYVKKLLKYIKVDVYGDCSGNFGQDNQCQASSNCNDIFSTFKFYLAFENSVCTDYITEKLKSEYDIKDEMETNNMTNTWHLGEELPVFLLLG